MHQRLVRLDHLLGVHGGGQRLVLDRDQFRRVLGDMAGFGDDGRDPFPGVSGHSDRKRVPFHVRYIETVIQGSRAGGDLVPGEHVTDARNRQGRRGVDTQDIRARVRARQHRDMKHARQMDVGHELAAPRDEPAVLLRAPLSRNVTVVRKARLRHRQRFPVAGARPAAPLRRFADSRCSGKDCRLWRHG